MVRGSLQQRNPAALSETREESNSNRCPSLTPHGQVWNIPWYYHVIWDNHGIWNDRVLVTMVGPWKYK